MALWREAGRACSATILEAYKCRSSDNFWGEAARPLLSNRKLKLPLVHVAGQVPEWLSVGESGLAAFG